MKRVSVGLPTVALRAAGLRAPPDARTLVMQVQLT